MHGGGSAGADGEGLVKLLFEGEGNFANIFRFEEALAFEVLAELQVDGGWRIREGFGPGDFDDLHYQRGASAGLIEGLLAISKFGFNIGEKVRLGDALLDEHPAVIDFFLRAGEAALGCGDHICRLALVQIFHGEMGVESVVEDVEVERIIQVLLGFGDLHCRD